MSDDRKLDRHAIKELSRELKRPIQTLLALAEQNDPFYVGATESSNEAAEWFAELYQAFGFRVGCHVRRIHYLLISQETPPLMRDGAPYENTLARWKKLSEASKHARYLGRVPIDDFEDHRNPEPVLHLPEPVEAPAIYCDGDGDFTGFSLPSKLPSPPEVFLSAKCPTACHVAHVKIAGQR
jgi:hypothetical protein